MDWALVTKNYVVIGIELILQNNSFDFYSLKYEVIEFCDFGVVCLLIVLFHLQFT